MVFTVFALQVLPSAEVERPVPPTPTNTPLPKATSANVDAEATFQADPSVEVPTTPDPVAVNLPLPYATLPKPPETVPLVRGVQVMPSVEVNGGTGVGPEGPSPRVPTATYVPPP